MRVLLLAFESVALLLQASLVLATPVGLLQHRHTMRKVPVRRTLAPRALADSAILGVAADSFALQGRNQDDKGKKNKKGNVEVSGTIVVISKPGGASKEDCDEKSFFKKIWCKVTT